MSITTTTVYGTWCNRVAQYSTSPDADVNDYVNGGDPEWVQRLEDSGALDAIKSEYRAAINAALPPDVALCGEQFIGPAYPENGEFDGYPQDEDGFLDLEAICGNIDLGPIVERNDPVTLEEIGLWHMNSKANNPAKAASAAMSRAGLKPYTYLPNPTSGRPQAIYLKGDVEAALAKRPGRGKRTDPT